MITPDTLAFIISAFCSFKDPKVSRDQKEACAEFMVNCAIIQDGKIPNKQVDSCKERWINYERRQKR